MAFLSVESLTVEYATPAGPIGALRDVSFSVGKGEALALVGESGSGKSTVALAVLGLLGPEARIVAGRVVFDGRDLLALPQPSLRALRGSRLGIVFQDPFASLNPALPIGAQVAEPLIYHRGVRPADALAKAKAALAEVGLPRPDELLKAYPHQLSGGMQQRVLIAQSLICDPELLILDEPTTALDVTVEAKILDLLDALRRSRGLTMLFITHNLGVVNRICDRACVLYAGSVLEEGPKAATLAAPLHPYTQGLLGSIVSLEAESRARLTPIPGRLPDLRQLPGGCIFHPRCAHVLEACRTEPQLMRPVEGRSVRCWRAGFLPHQAPAPDTAAADGAPKGAPLVAVRDLHKAYPLASRLVIGGPTLLRLQRREVRAVNGVSLTIRAGEVLGLVGESGSGKSTLGQCIARLSDASSGEISFLDRDVTAARGGALRAFRRDVQIIFQNPMSSLNPRRRVGATIGRSLALLGRGRGERAGMIGKLLEAVGLPADYARRYPHQLSGGERQRVSIARALASEPKFIVCDEPISALDVSVQATVLNLLADLRDRLKLAYLFISHDLSAVAHIADRIAVMYAGALLEEGPTAQVLAPPFHPYTEALLSAVPSIDRAHRGDRIRLRGDAGETGEAMKGCPFHRRCPRKIGAICEESAPPLVRPAPAHWIRCHLPVEELRRPTTARLVPAAG
ncbi:MAG TPA: ABC transporter ATP-binding protein [Xanthobacteraceae bacterium]|nr:ABC transporter ATP-binding protein [Xanthobacteraceae bacterium]